MNNDKMESILLPGQPLNTVRTPKPQSGSGTYERGSHLLSSLVGQAKGASESSTQSVYSGSSSRFVVPRPGSTILGRVTRVTPRQANVSILIIDGLPCSMGDRSSASFANHAAGEDPLGGDFTGVIRLQDVRATEKDKIRLGDCFRPGDIVRSIVISLGDARSYFLSTASNHLGVVYALPSPSPSALNGNQGSEEALIPINWQEMQCPRTGVIEKRKVAKPE